MKFFFDTSVLVAAALIRHEHHERSLRAYSTASRIHSCCAAHSLAEVYATLTRLPGPQRISCEQALLFLDNINERLTTIVLDSEEYSAAIADSAGKGLVGGIIYDALIAKCALKAGAATLFTWNVSHFLRVGPEMAKRVRTP